MATAAEIQIELDDVKLAIKRVLTGGQEYAIDTSQTKRMNKRAPLKDLQALKESLDSDLCLAQLKESGTQRGRGVM